MSIKAHSVALKQHFERLFPGKWMSGKEQRRTILTGLAQIDQHLLRGISRQRLTEWAGLASSGKTTILRAAITNWCTQGLHVAYIDCAGKLIASDWTSVGEKIGRFWVVRPADITADLSGKHRQEGNKYRWRNVHYRGMEEVAIWLIRSNAFDVVILDLADENAQRQLSNYFYARLQNVLGRSKAALIVMRDSDEMLPGWGCHARLHFQWGTTVHCVAGIGGIAVFAPTIQLSIWQDGLTKTTEVAFAAHVSNRLFTHSQVSDRRTSKS